MKSENKLNVLLIISNIIMLISLIAYLILRNDIIKSLYWTLIPLLILIIIVFINNLSKRGLNVDKSNSNLIQRSFDDITAVAIVIYGCIYLGILFIESAFNKNVKSNIYVIVGFYILTLIFELITYTSVYAAKKDTKKLVEKTYKKTK